MDNNKCSNKTNIYWFIGFIFIVIIGFFIAIANKSPKQKVYTLNIKQKEQLAVTQFRLDVAEAVLEEKEFSLSDCTAIRNIVKKYNPKSDWFESCEGNFRLNSADTEEKNINTISNDTHCATLTFDKDLTKLIDYSFKKEQCKGYSAKFK